MIRSPNVWMTAMTPGASTLPVTTSKYPVKDRIGDLDHVANFLRPELLNGRFRRTFADLVLGQLLERRDIAYLARGSVQAGYNLKDITADSYFYCPTTKTLFLSSRVQVFS